jgi:hypothetical protein
MVKDLKIFLPAIIPWLRLAVLLTVQIVYIGVLH